MVLSNKLLRSNFFSSGLINLLPLLSQTIVYLIVLRNTDLNGLGEYFIIMSFVSFVSLFMDMGISTTVTKYLSEFSDDVIFVDTIISWQIKTRIFLGLIIIVLFLSFQNTILFNFSKGSNNDAYFLALISAIISSIANSLSPILVALNKVNLLSKYQLLSSLALIFCIGFRFYNSSFNLYDYSILLLVHSIFSFLAAFLIQKRQNILRVSNVFSDRAIWKYFSELGTLVSLSSNSRSGKSIFQFLFNVSLGIILAGITMRIDIVLVNKSLELSDVAVYGFFQKFVIPITVLSSTVVTYLSPLVNRKGFSIILFTKEKLPKKVILLTLILLVFYLIFGVYLTTFILRRELLNYSYIGSLLVLFSSASIILNPISLYGYNFGFDKFYPIINVVQLLVIYIFYTFLVGKFGLVMAVAAYGSNYVIGAIFLFLLFKRKYSFSLW